MSREVQWLAWKICVGDFVKSLWYSSIFVVRLVVVNPMPAVGNSNCVAGLPRSMVTSKILPRFLLLASFVIWRDFCSRKQIFAVPKSSVMPKFVQFRRTNKFYVASFLVMSVPGGPNTLCCALSNYIHARWTKNFMFALVLTYFGWKIFSNIRSWFNKNLFTFNNSC